ncbi:protein cortex-like isoform X1 [Hylaeus anthracinus]|uniref:protein cortex-like isoform X1 n=1 Tax=Hylaeus anthracinus TaxID=313031 RepID=UPI0023B97715|nr:protein cortex-like isoform X1 [Hylaeus anthracinus]
MQRIRLRFDNEEYQHSEEIETTPLRRSSVRFPRLRLADMDFKSDDLSKLPTSNYQSALTNVSAIDKKFPPQCRRQYSDDRFIVPRCKFNAEASHYALTKKNPPDLAKENELNVFEEMENLPLTWRKKMFHELMVKENVIPGLKQKGVLHGNHLCSENKLPGNLAGCSNDVWDEEYIEEGTWKSKPRKRPLIHSMDAILELPGIERSLQSEYRLIDWSSKNIIATATWESVLFFDSSMSGQLNSLNKVTSGNLCALTWNHAGDKLVICTLSSSIKLICIHTKKIIWSTKCRGIVNCNCRCYVRCVCWSKDDQHIVTGCAGLISVYLATTGKLINVLLAHTTPILKLAFSANGRYLVSSSMDSILRIYLWPKLKPYFDITYYEPIKALAWHPQDGGLLCTGGGLGDASLSLWNINKCESLSYRLVEFYGAVENLAWNKLSGELVVHWSYWLNERQYTIMPVLAGLDRFVDALPLERNVLVKSIMWNADHTKLATYGSDFFSTWNFFGNENCHQQQRKQRERAAVRECAKVTGSKGFGRFTIR